MVWKRSEVEHAIDEVCAEHIKLRGTLGEVALMFAESSRNVREEIYETATPIVSRMDILNAMCVQLTYMYDKSEED